MEGHSSAVFRKRYELSKNPQIPKYSLDQSRFKCCNENYLGKKLPQFFEEKNYYKNLNTMEGNVGGPKVQY